jgi:hypothetical protein
MRKDHRKGTAGGDGEDRSVAAEAPDAGTVSLSVVFDCFLTGDDREINDLNTLCTMSKQPMNTSRSDRGQKEFDQRAQARSADVRWNLPFPNFGSFTLP